VDKSHGRLSRIAKEAVAGPEFATKTLCGGCVLAVIDMGLRQSFGHLQAAFEYIVGGPDHLDATREERDEERLCLRD